MNENTDEVNPLDPVPVLRQYRERIASGDLTLDGAASELAEQGGPDFGEDDARVLLAPPNLTPLGTDSLSVIQSWGQLGLGEPAPGHTLHWASYEQRLRATNEARAERVQARSKDEDSS